MIGSNPANPTPQSIATELVEIEVAYIDFHGAPRKGVIEINKSVAEDVREFFAQALAIDFPINKIVRSSDAPYFWDDDKLVADNTTSGFNYRFIKGTKRASLHGLGLAIDVNTRLNPFIRYDEEGGESVDPPGAVYDPTQPGTLTAGHPLVVFMKQRGWEWGGDWTKESGRIDWQHFQKEVAV